MQILELQMKNFGKFANHTISFHEGVNIIYGENEMGKSTIHAFIRGMLFGIDKMRGKASKNDEYTLRQPWENPGYFAGVLRFQSGQKIFRIERSFSKTDKRAVLICETDGEELDIAQGDLQVLLEGLNETAFRNTIFIRQNTSHTDEGLAGEIRNYLANCENAGDDEIDVSRAIETLKKKKKDCETQKKQQEKKEEERFEQIQIKVDYVVQEIRKLEQQQEETKARIAEVQKKELHERKIEQGKKEEKRGQFLFVPVAAGAFLLGIFISNIWVKIFLWMAAVLLFLGFSYLEYKARIQSKEKTMVAKDVSGKVQKLSWGLERIQEELHEKQVVYENLRESQRDIRGIRAGYDKLSNDMEALDLAIATIQEASKEIYKLSARRLDRKASSILSEVTEGRYTSIFLDENMQVRINTPQKLLFLEQVSRGTMDQINFALRMAVAKMFLKGERMPLIFDDAFVMYDDRRLEQTIRWLAKDGSQVLLFTCHKREQEILERIRHQ